MKVRYIVLVFAVVAVLVFAAAEVLKETAAVPETSKALPRQQPYLQRKVKGNRLFRRLRKL